MFFYFSNNICEKKVYSNSFFLKNIYDLSAKENNCPTSEKSLL